MNSIEEQIRSAIFGIDLYMVRDRDGLTNEQILSLEANGRIRCLKRRHIENYFLDSEILSKVAERLYLETAGADFSSSQLGKDLLSIAEEASGYTLYKSFNEYLKANHNLKAPSVKDLQQKTLADLKDALVTQVGDNLNKLARDLDPKNIQKWLDREEQFLNDSLKNGEWVSSFQGKYIFKIFCGKILKEDDLRVRNAYIDIALEIKPQIFSDITNLFKNM